MLSNAHNWFSYPNSGFYSRNSPKILLSHNDDGFALLPSVSFTRSWTPALHSQTSCLNIRVWLNQLSETLLIHLKHFRATGSFKDIHRDRAFNCLLDSSKCGLKPPQTFLSCPCYLLPFLLPHLVWLNSFLLLSTASFPGIRVQLLWHTSHRLLLGTYFC